MIKMVVFQPNPGPAIMPWLSSRYQSLLLTISEGPRHSECEISKTAEKFSRTSKIGKKRPHVGFSDLIDVREVPPTGSLSQSSGTCTWWTREDYSRMRLNVKDIVSKMTDNRPLTVDRSSQVCTLGLETFSRFESQKRKERRGLITKAVLNAQQKHRIEGFEDEVYIAEISRSISRASAEEAYLRANDKGVEVEIPRIEESIDEQDFVEIRI